MALTEQDMYGVHRRHNPIARRIHSGLHVAMATTLDMLVPRILKRLLDISKMCTSAVRIMKTYTGSGGMETLILNLGT
jgi:hypothetical protein